MGNDVVANEIKDGGCSTCGRKVNEESRNKVASAIDWHRLFCVEYDWSQTAEPLLNQLFGRVETRGSDCV
jgi:hypothetical protein